MGFHVNVGRTTVVGLDDHGVDQAHQRVVRLLYLALDFLMIALRQFH